MGSLLENKEKKSVNIRFGHLSKGQRKGWKHISEYRPVPLKLFIEEGERLIVYPKDKFLEKKIVP